MFGHHSSVNFPEVHCPKHLSTKYLTHRLYIISTAFSHCNHDHCLYWFHNIWSCTKQLFSSWRNPLSHQPLQTSITSITKILNHLQSNLYLSQKNLQDPDQSGFKASRSTEMSISEKLHTATSVKLSSVLILLHSVSSLQHSQHQDLRSIFINLEIYGAALQWLAFYLDGRSYQVAWKWSTSAPRRLSTDVPQDSALSPLTLSI